MSSGELIFIGNYHVRLLFQLRIISQFPSNNSRIFAVSQGFRKERFRLLFSFLNLSGVSRYYYLHLPSGADSWTLQVCRALTFRWNRKGQETTAANATRNNISYNGKFRKGRGVTTLSFCLCSSHVSTRKNNWKYRTRNLGGDGVRVFRSSPDCERWSYNQTFPTEVNDEITYKTPP